MAIISCQSHICEVTIVPEPCQYFSAAFVKVTRTERNFIFFHCENNHLLYSPNYLFDSMVLVNNQSKSKDERITQVERGMVYTSKVTYYALLPFHRLDIDKVYNSTVTPQRQSYPAHHGRVILE